MEKYGYRFSFGPWNIHEGADPFGPPVRPERDFESKLEVFKELGFDMVQFHDDDAVPGLDDLSPEQMRQHARATRQRIADQGLTAEFVAPRLWEHPMTIDGAFTSNDAKVRSYALDRAKKTIDIARELGTDLVVLWLAREGTYMREAKNALRATQQLLERAQYHANLRRAHTHRHRTQTKRADGHVLHPHHGTRHRSRLSNQPPGENGRLDGIGPRNPGRA